MLVELTRPVFKCRDDEKIFFSRLAEIAGYESVVGKAAKLQLRVISVSADELVSELQEISAFWHIEFQVVGD